MFVHWGKRTVREFVGRWADFCPVCHDVTVRSVVALSSQTHLYHFVPIGRRSNVAYEATCEGCGLCCVEPTAVGPIDPTVGSADVHRLLTGLSPQRRAQIERRLELEERVRRGKLTHRERQTLMVELFTVLEGGFKPRTKEVQVDRFSGFMFIIAVFGSIILLGVGEHRGKLPPTKLPAGVFAAVTFGLSLLGMATHATRYFRGRIEPLLVRGLKPLRVTDEELAQVIGELKRADYAKARYAKADRMMAALRRME